MAKRCFEINPEVAEYLDEEELDSIRAMLVYILMKDTDMEKNMIYDLVFNEGNTIIWH
jgi:hypothetical protein